MEERKEGEWLGHIECLWHKTCTGLSSWTISSAFRALYIYMYTNIPSYRQWHPLLSQMT